MATTFVVPIVRRVISSNMFADLGYPNVTITPIVDPLGGVTFQVDLVETLTAAQIQRARIRLKTVNSTDEATLVNALGPVLDTLNVIIAQGTRTSAQNSADIKVLAQDVKGIINWLGHDVTG